MPTPEEIAKQITQGIVDVINARDVTALSGMNNIKANFVERIFQNGQDVDSGKIGDYSTDPMYVSVQKNSQTRSSSLKPRGKNSDSDKFKNGNPRKSQYFQDGYSGYRAQVGRSNDTVNLNLTGQTQSELGSPTYRNGYPSIEFQNDKTVEIAAGNEERFGKTIFAVPDDEIDTFVTEVLDAQEQAFFKAFGL